MPFIQSLRFSSSGRYGLEMWNKTLFRLAGVYILYKRKIIIIVVGILKWLSSINYRELGKGIVPYSPLGRGFFSSGAKLVDSLSDKDVRKVN